ncbi:GMC oxidoreductase [Macroventuria anomochaeta]|uniref:GMC oxidoreductase n=1 Tax=Macroventuria anomochaeta TaxID=301207 RepID=A0ACB6RZH3_9PLEO|nr:GMC oxidoreductase [Macroventuria anomochaeta]KAF2627375.1 GMC oxidoreductase [Macroventuria anomochaeta]
MRSSTRCAVALQLLGMSAALRNNTPVENETRVSDTYDYVIVGGGVTGLIVANRLTEDKKKSVLVIEAGGAYDNPNIRLPYGATYALNTSLLWTDYVCQPEPALNNKTWDTRVAQVLGGGSIVNGMMYDRGSAADYDAWEALGNKGWGWSGLYPFFKKETEFIPPPQELVDEFNITWDAAAYGTGPLKLGIADFQYPDIKSYWAAFEGQGARRLVDGNNGDNAGASWYPNTMNPKTGERQHARLAYYDTVASRLNLHTLLGTVANELVFDNNSSKRLVARGVKVTDKKTGATKTVYAKREVILATGAVNTPKLLQLSGIGPKSVLEAAGITVKLAHDGVGSNFQDHPYTYMGFNISNMSTPNPALLSIDPAFNASAWAEYNGNKTGPLTQARGNALAFIPLPEVAPDSYANISTQVTAQANDAYLPAIYKGSKRLLTGVAAQRKVLASLYSNSKAGIVEFGIPAAGNGLLVALQKPLSRGTITINPTNPQGVPLIRYNAMINPLDKSILAVCVRYIRQVWARSEIAQFTPVETSPGAQYQTDAEIIDRVVELGTLWPTLSHPSGSCPMMPEALGGCVSDELLFYGVEKLSVIDASIIPLVPSQHIQSTMYAVGEKAGYIISNRR